MIVKFLKTFRFIMCFVLLNFSVSLTAQITRSSNEKNIKPKKKAKKVSKKTNYLKKAKKLFEAEKYLDSMWMFYKLYKKSKVLETKREAEYYLGLSLFELDLFYTSSKYFTNIVRRGSVNNNFFNQSLDALIEVNYEASLDDSHISQIFSSEVDADKLSESSQSFYNFQKGVDFFYESQNEEDPAKLKKSINFFRLVSKKGNYYAKANFYLGVINAISGNSIKAVGYFRKSVYESKGLPNHYWILEQAYMNLGRIYYQMEEYAQSIRMYSKIPRNSENWLEANFEAAWAFYLMDKPNNALGNVHTILSPFFEERFFPEAHILQAVSFVSMCHYDRTKEALIYYKRLYKKFYKDMKPLIKLGKKNASDFFKIIYKYKTGNLKKYGESRKILTALTNTDDYRKVGITIRQANDEIKYINRVLKRKKFLNIKKTFVSFLKRKKSFSIKDAGSRLLAVAESYRDSIVELFAQADLIEAELRLGEVSLLRDKSEVGKKSQDKFIGGMQELKIGERLEYWPVEPIKNTISFVDKYEWWEDELGGYIYNLSSKCSS